MLPEEREKLLEYLKNVIAIETDIANQNQIKKATLDEFKARMPILKQKEIPVISSGTTAKLNNKEKEVFASLILGGVGCLGMGIIFAAACSPYDSTDFKTPMTIFIFVGSIFLIASYLYRAKKIKALTQKVKSNEKVRNDVIEQNVHQKEVYFKQLKELEDSKQKILNSMVEPFKRTNDIRNKLYAQGLIYQKYLNLPALTSIYEYFITGRCDELTGPHGAYNMYEDEVRKDTVISQLNTVIENLEQIKQNQYMLYQQVKSIQQTTGAIFQELSQIKGYTIAMTQLTALTAYYTALNERNSRIMMYYHLAP